MQCPVCRMEESFDAKHPIVSIMACDFLKLVHELSLVQTDNREDDDLETKYDSKVNKCKPRSSFLIKNQT